ncbi:MAG: large subunit ribosomal protein L10 [Natronomonas sp.]|jgi:large subunit ribosomal protein L10|uniref:50S ribosomal protein L10 n=1 Tax=Natronomonas sp. TaxID=2184060 RepID=UPI003989E04D
MSAEAERKTETIPKWKREETDAIVEFLKSYSSIGVVDITGIPSKQLQDMRRELHGTAALRVSRNTLIERALDDVGDGIEDLAEHVEGQVGLIGTNDNPFGLYQQLEASKTPAPINAGEVAPNDIVIPEGDTGVDPGPFVGELQTVGANARIDGGSIKVVEDSTVLSADEEVSADLANVLTELGIEPKEVGLDLRGVFSEGVLFSPEELDIDIEEYVTDLKAASSAARNLSLNAEYPTAQTAPSMLAKAAGEAKSVGLSAAVESPDLADDLVSKADAQVRALAGAIDDDEALPKELRGVETAPATPAADAETADEDEAEDEADEAATDESSDEDEDGAEDDADDGGDALGDMFG